MVLLRPDHLVCVWRVGAVFALMALAAGCPPRTGPDSHTEVFLTPDQIRAQREAKLIAQWKVTAVSLVKGERPDIVASATDPFGVTLGADGQTMAVDLLPLKPALLAPNANSEEILRPPLMARVVAFDQQRLAALGYQRARAMLAPRLIAAEEATQLAANLGEATLPRLRSLPAGGHWTPVVCWPGSDHFAALSSLVIKAWSIDPPMIEQQALDNIRGQVDEQAIRTMPLGLDGKLGVLQSPTNAAVVLRPEFLALVRRTWQTDDDLVMLIAGRNDVRFVRRNDQATLNMIQPFWQSRLAQPPRAICTSPVLLSDRGLQRFVSATTSTSQAVTRPATRAYITH